MKRLIQIILFAVTAATQIQAQEAFYIYRNDGHFNAFFNEEVDSIVYSKTGIDSLVYEDFVVQEVYTADSLYRIPLASIDSVGFSKPDVKYKPNVRRVEELMSKYLKNADGLKLTFSEETPSEERPMPGDILLCLDDNPMFEDGFAGKVLKTTHEGKDIFVECDSINDLSEIFSQFIAVENISIPNDASRARRSDGHFDVDLFTYDSNLEWEFLKTEKVTAKLDGHFGGGCNIKGVYRFTDDEQFLELTQTNRMELGVGLSIEGEIGKINDKLSRKLLNIPGVCFPTACPIFKCQFTPYLFLRGELTAGFYLHGDIFKEEINTLTYHNGKFGFQRTKGKARKPELDWGADFSIDGYVQGGVRLNFFFGTRNILGLAIVGMNLDLYIGPKLSGKLNVDVDELFKEPHVYDVLKDSKVELALPSLDFEVTGEAKFLGQVEKEHTFYEASVVPVHWDFYLFPEFSETTITKKPKFHSARLQSDVSRSIIPFVSLKLGYGLYDDKGLIRKVYDERPYKFLNNYNTLDLELDSIPLGQYTVRPIIDFWNHDIPASPEAELDFALKPYADKATDISYQTATLNGHVEGDIEYVNDACEVGFIFSKTKDDIKNGKQVKATLNPQGKMSQTVNNLEPGTTYYYMNYFYGDKEYVYSDEVESFTTPIPITITDFTQNASSYYPEHFDYNGGKYSFKYDCTTTVELKTENGVENWGYVYEDADGKKSRISLKGAPLIYPDSRFSYYRNEPQSKVKLYPFVKYTNDTNYHYGEAVEYPIAYDNPCSITLASCEFKGTKENVEYRGSTYDYCSTFRFVYSATGGYWLKVEVLEDGNGWDNWDNGLLADVPVTPVDGSNALTVNYYYNKKDFKGEFKAYLKGTDETHNAIYTTDEYVVLDHNGTTFTGCSIPAQTAAFAGSRELLLDEGAHGATINKIIK